MIVSNEMLARINATVYQCFVKVLGEEKAKKHIVQVRFRNDMRRVAGLAYMNKNLIELNFQLFDKYTEAFFNRTIPHEAAHLITRILFPKAKQAHGPEWRHVMNILGVDSSTYHKYDISCAYPEGSLFTYVCACENKKFLFTKIKHNKASKGVAYYTHTACGSRLIHHTTKDQYGV
jgi:SprT protein